MTPAHPDGLHHDLPQLSALARQVPRRRLLHGLGLAGLAATLPMLGACGGGGGGAVVASGTTGGTSGGGSGSSGSSGSSSGTAACSTIPSETAGPYPGDGSNQSNGATSNALGLASIVRSDITRSIDGASGTAAGVPLTVTLTLVDASNACAPLAGHAVYLWHCDRSGLYSLYSAGVTDQNYLRGVQVSDVNGQLSFQTIVPGCYSGRWPHIHFEVFASLASANRGANALKTSQLALPAAACQQVYGQASGYDASVANLAAITLASDNVFGNDSAALQLASVSGSLAAGYTAALQVAL